MIRPNKLGHTRPLSYSSLYFPFIEITCPAPPLPEHVEKLVIPGCFDDNPTYKTICKFECGPGYVAVSGSKTRMCKKDGSWSGEDLECESKNNIVQKVHEIPGIWLRAMFVDKW